MTVSDPSIWYHIAVAKMLVTVSGHLFENVLLWSDVSSHLFDVILEISQKKLPKWSREAPSKFHRKSFQNDRARPLPNFTQKASKLRVSYEASYNFWLSVVSYCHQLLSSCCCGQGLVVSYLIFILLWSGVGDRLCALSLEGPFRNAFGKNYIIIYLYICTVCV